MVERLFQPHNKRTPFAVQLCGDAREISLSAFVVADIKRKGEMKVGVQKLG